MSSEVKPPRADARRNREALLVAAADVFAEHGVGASLEEVARRAGVGVGTLYRHFEQRDALVAAVYRRELERVVDAVPELLDGRVGMAALRAWSERFLGYVAAKRGMGEALRAIMDCAPELRSTVLPRLEGAVEELVAHGVEDGSIRADARADDVLRAMIGVFHLPQADGWEAQARRILDLLLDGLEPR